MADREKVIKGLEHCRQYGTLCGKDCSGVFSYTDNLEDIVKIGEHRHDCQYGKCKTGCVVTLVDDAIALLKEQETTEYDYNEYAEPTCKSCGYRPFAGYIPTLKWMQQRGYNYCPGCGKKVKWDAAD